MSFLGAGGPVDDAVFDIQWDRADGKPIEHVEQEAVVAVTPHGAGDCDDWRPTARVQGIDREACQPWCSNHHGSSTPTPNIAIETQDSPISRRS